MAAARGGALPLAAVLLLSALQSSVAQPGGASGGPGSNPPPPAPVSAFAATSVAIEADSLVFESREHYDFHFACVDHRARAAGAREGPWPRSPRCLARARDLCDVPGGRRARARAAAALLNTRPAVALRRPLNETLQLSPSGCFPVSGLNDSLFQAPFAGACSAPISLLPASALPSHCQTLARTF